MLKYVLLLVVPLLSLGCFPTGSTTNSDAQHKVQVKEVMDAAASFSRHEKTDKDVAGLFEALASEDYKELAGERDQSKTFSHLMLLGKASDSVKGTLDKFAKGLSAQEVEAQLNGSMGALRATRAAGEQKADLDKLVVFVLSKKPSEINNIKDSTNKFAMADFVSLFGAVSQTNDKGLEDAVIKAVEKANFTSYVAWMENNLADAKSVFPQFYRNAAQADQVVLENQALWAAYQDSNGIKWLVKNIADFGFAHKITSGAKTFKLQKQDGTAEHEGSFLYVIARRTREDIAGVQDGLEAVLNVDTLKQVAKKVKRLFADKNQYEIYAGYKKVEEPQVQPAGSETKAEAPKKEEKEEAPAEDAQTPWRALTANNGEAAQALLLDDAKEALALNDDDDDDTDSENDDDDGDEEPVGDEKKEGGSNDDEETEDDESDDDEKPAADEKKDDAHVPKNDNTKDVEGEDGNDK